MAALSPLKMLTLGRLEMAMKNFRSSSTNSCLLAAYGALFGSTIGATLWPSS